MPYARLLLLLADMFMKDSIVQILPVAYFLLMTNAVITVGNETQT